MHRKGTQFHGLFGLNNRRVLTFRAELMKEIDAEMERRIAGSGSKLSETQIKSIREDKEFAMAAEIASEFAMSAIYLSPKYDFETRTKIKELVSGFVENILLRRYSANYEIPEPSRAEKEVYKKFNVPTQINIIGPTKILKERLEKVIGKLDVRIFIKEFSQNFEKLVPKKYLIA